MTYPVAGRVRSMMLMMFSWLKWLSRRSSRRVRLASVRCSNTLDTFLMATFSPVAVLRAALKWS